MSFSSCLFLFVFFPIVFIIFKITPMKLKKSVLLIISLAFYAISSIKTIPILICSIIINYAIGKCIKKFNKNKRFLLLGIVFNIGILFFYKYTNFLLVNINKILSTNIQLLNLLLPLGISFFTFQSISYLVDIYKNKDLFDKNIINFALYTSFFPRIISGPIVRYDYFKENIENIKVPSIDEFYDSIKRICFGLGKILILSAIMGEIWNKIKGAVNVSDVSIVTAWFA